MATADHNDVVRWIHGRGIYGAAIAVSRVSRETQALIRAGALHQSFRDGLSAGPGTYEHGLYNGRRKQLQNWPISVCMGSGLAALLRPGMTLIVISVYRRGYSSNTGYRSRQSGFCSSISRIFQSRRHFFSAFSRAIASLGSS